MTRVLIVAHGQPGDPEPQQQAVETLAARIAPHLPQAQVQGATLAMPGALNIAAAETLIYPMFMASGWFTRSELPRRLALAGAEGARVLEPFGSHPGLPALCLHLITDAAAGQGWALADTDLLIAAHGSGRSRAPSTAARAMADRLAPHVATTHCGFIEEAPFLADAARDLGPQALCLPLFVARWGHVRDDLPEALAKAEFQGRVLDPLGCHPAVPALIAAALSRQAE